MITATPYHDKRLRERLESLTRINKDYWSFKGNSPREHGHGLFQYPAMMVPQVARAILKYACEVHPDIECVGDPFAGSGTILTESILHGLSFCGKDINPLAVLLCRVKAGPFYMDALSSKTVDLMARIAADTSSIIEVSFPNQNKWFKDDVQVALSRIRRSILSEDRLWARRFFWVGLAETVRLSGNSRTSTFKLHIRPAAEIKARSSEVVSIFKKAIDRNLKHLKDLKDCLKAAGYLHNGYYRNPINVTLGDARQTSSNALSDIILTSPPYGDNTSTVPYGQYSYLPLQWIELSDIDPNAGAEYLRSTYEIDKRSLGGRRSIKNSDREHLANKSPAFKECIARLRDQPPDRADRITAFFRDLDSCLEAILQGLRPGGIIVWTLGNRKVGGLRVPLDTIISELLSIQGVSLICSLNRHISSKRMAFKNNIADTMSDEAILVMRKAIV